MRIESKQEDRHGPKIDRSAGTFPGRVPLSTPCGPYIVLHYAFRTSDKCVELVWRLWLRKTAQCIISFPLLAGNELQKECAEW